MVAEYRSGYFEVADIGQIFDSDRRVLHFHVLAGGDSDKLYLSMQKLE